MLFKLKLYFKPVAKHLQSHNPTILYHHTVACLMHVLGSIFSTSACRPIWWLACMKYVSLAEILFARSTASGRLWCAQWDSRRTCLIWNSSIRLKIYFVTLVQKTTYTDIFSKKKTYHIKKTFKFATSS